MMKFMNQVLDALKSATCSCVAISSAFSCIAFVVTGGCTPGWFLPCATQG